MMNTYRSLVLTSFLLAFFWFSSSVVHATESTSILVKITETAQIPAEYQSTILAEHFGIVQLAIPRGMTTESYATFWRAARGVEWAEPNSAFHLSTTTPNDPRYATQTSHSQLALPVGWDETTGSSSVTVAIVDSGVDGQHEDLVGRVVAGYNFVADRTTTATETSDDNGHGTMIAGIIGALTNNNKGITGVDWQAKLMPLKVANASGEANAAYVASAITYAVDHGAKVINLSLGSPDDHPAIKTAVGYAYSHGVVLVAAAGNCGDSSYFVNGCDHQDQTLYPSGYGEVISVGSVGPTDVQSTFSNSGPEVDLVAPGELITSAKLSSVKNEYTQASGTSMAAPFVSGIASLMVARYPHLGPAEIAKILRDQADKPLGMGNESFTASYGYGRANAARSLSTHTQFVSQNTYPELRTGQTFKFQVILKNTGASTWYRDTFNLGTDRNRDRIPGFIREDRTSGQGSGWTSPNRVALVEQSVTPGATGTFDFYYTVPTDKPLGTYREYFRPVYDGLDWLDDWGIYWDVSVVSLAQSYRSQFVSQNNYPTLARGQTYQFEVVLKNTGSSTWTQDVVNLGTDRAADRIPRFIREDRASNNSSGWLTFNRVSLVEATVPAGNTGTFRFYYTVPTDIALGTYREYFRPVADGVTWMEDWGIYWDVKVQ